MLPLVYDNSLSYYEVLCKVVDYLNKIIDTLEQWDEDLKDYVDQRIDSLTQDWLETVYNILNEYTAQFDGKLDAEHEWNVQEHAKILANLSAQIQAINEVVEKSDISLRLYINSELQKLRDEIPEITSVQVVDPTSGKIVPIQTALNNVYDFLRCCALTASEYDSLQLTAEKYDSYSLTAMEYDLYAKAHLWPHIPLYYTFSPFNGQWTRLQYVIDDLAALHRATSPTAQEYDNAEYTADAYDALQTTAYNYSWNFQVA